jgi:hypothetical protein
MTQAQERRAQGASRVPIETLVEICGNEPGIPAFEAQALDVSAQGMHLRTAYLPERGAPLVCRFEDHGREIVVEGVVAWRKESAKGGDFGVAFTALDSRSVDALKSLVQAGDSETKEAQGEASNGARVRLHIEGLGSPMKARIRTGSSQKIQVGSSLEFLKVGRKLEVEDLDAGGRRCAQIDGVEVVIDPRTSVPQLVVALRYDGAPEDTPEPTVTDLGADPVRPQTLRIAPEAVTMQAPASEAADPTPSGDVPEAKGDDEAEDDDTDEDELDAAVPATTRAARRLGHAAENAGSVARDASAAAARWGSERLGQLFAGAAAKFANLRAHKHAPPKRRTTAKPVDAPSALDSKKLRPQSAGKSAETATDAAPERKKSKRAVIGIAVAVAAASAGVIALRPAKVSSKTASAAAASTVLAAAPGAGDAALVAPAVTALATGVVPLPGSAPAAQSSAFPPNPAPPPGSPVTANVPLFGPTPLATTEPAPLGPPPVFEAKGVEEAELTAAKAVTPPTASDEEFPDPIEHVDASKKNADAKSADGKSERPEDVPAWGKGKLHAPTIHRLRLDGPGAALHGVADATGFTVLVPGRKLMEQGDAIIKRDPRVGRARTTNTPGGAQLRITFRETLPGYRVRLRRDYIELLISAPEETSAKKSESPKASKETKDAKEGTKAAAKTSVASKSIPAKHEH